MARPPKNAEEKPQLANSDKNRLASLLDENKSDHYNDYEKVEWKISTGSLLLDTAIGGGLTPSLLRMCGYMNEGKTSQTLEIVRNFLNSIPNSKAFWMIAEGRGLSEENKARCQLKFVYKAEDWEPGTVFVLESNIFELFISVVKDLVKNNPESFKYVFVVDSVDGLQLRDDATKEITESNKVAGVPALSKKMMQSLSLGMFKFGHLMVLLSQVTSEIKLDPYTKTVNRGGSYSGGNALNHGADYIFMYNVTTQNDYILDNPKGKMNDGKSKPIGKYCKVTIEKSAREVSRKKQVVYPILFGKKPSGIWVEIEIIDSLLAWEFVVAKGAWITVEDSLIEELKAAGLEMPKQHNGQEKFRLFLEENPEITKFLFNKFRKVIAE